MASYETRQIQCTKWIYVFKITSHPSYIMKLSALAFKSEQESCNIYKILSILQQTKIAEGFSKIKWKQELCMWLA